MKDLRDKSRSTNICIAFFSVSHRGLYLNMDNQHSFFFTLALFVASVAVVVIVLMKKWSACKAKLLSISSLSHGNFFSKILIMTVALSLSLSLARSIVCWTYSIRKGLLLHVDLVSCRQLTDLVLWALHQSMMVPQHWLLYPVLGYAVVAVVVVAAAANVGRDFYFLSSPLFHPKHHHCQTIIFRVTCIVTFYILAHTWARHINVIKNSSRHSVIQS